MVIVTFTTRKHDHPGHSHDHVIGLGTTLDFLDTLELDEGSLVEHLESPIHAIRWIAEHGLVHAESADAVIAAYGRSDRSGARDLARVRRVRAALREVAEAVVEGRSPDAGSIDDVNRVLRSRPVARVEAAPDGVRVGHDHEEDPLDDALARLAEPLVHEIASGRPDRLRICDNDRCRWLFYDASPTGRRRWCDMASCGNRAKAARHRARVRSGTRGPRRVAAARAR